MSGAEVKRVDPREHVLLRPDMYIGSTYPEKTKGWFVNASNKLYVGEGQFVPGLYKIFDEIITNASDNKQRDKDRAKKQTYIKVQLTSTPEGKLISVQNDGIEGFLKFNAEEKMYVPQLAFGILMTSSNYEDTEKRVTGGRNGFGAKLTNIFSKQFTVEVRENGQQYVQTWRNNMLDKTEPQITKCKTSDNYLKISFLPDYQRFYLQDMTTDDEDLLRRRVFDIAGCNEKLLVYLNGEKLPISGFQDYARLIFAAANPQAINYLAIEPTEPTQTSMTVQTDSKPKKKDAPWQDQFIAYYYPHEYWDIAVFYSEVGEFQQLSFVNSICTTDGGSHVEYLLDNLIAPMNDLVKKFLAKDGVKDPKELTRAQVKNNIFVIIRSLIENPSFDSQTKTALKTTKAYLKKTLTFSDTEAVYKKFLKQLASNSNLLQTLGNLVSKTQQKMLAKNDGAKKLNVVVPKLDDAAAAGGAYSNRCYLFLTEGDSAKSLAVEGISQLNDGRKYYGVFPLRGKVLNVREVSHDKLAANAEINNLKKILGLRQNCKYETTEEFQSLRYGKVVIMADYDPDGSHIKGLILNVFDSFWPGLLKRGYVYQFITPIVRCKRKSGNEVVDFYTLYELSEWIAQQADIKRWHVQYYKGLGTSDKAEARDYFSATNLKRNQKQFVYDGTASYRLNLAFHKQLADKRKDWLRETDADVYLDNKKEKINISDFVDRELVLYEKYANIRAIPSAIDGLKPSQRKILFASLKRKLYNPIKVVQLSGNVSENAAYHHGEVSLNEAIVALAQYFTGANNIPLLVPKGTFGSRARGGKDSAAPRYIYTCLQPIVKYIFMAEDEELYERVCDDNQVVEPIFYTPILPMVLCNGAAGIGTGYSTTVPYFNPRDVLHSLRLRLYKKSTRRIRYGEDQMRPWYRDWDGGISVDYFDENKVRVERWTFDGRFDIVNENTIRITELPPQVWTEEYREMLQNWMTGKADDKEKVVNKPQITNVSDFSDNDRVNILVQFASSYASQLLAGVKTKQCTEEPYYNVLKALRLYSSLKTTNMVLHNEKGQLQYYLSVQQVIDQFFKVRLVFYQRRKQFILDALYDKLIEKSERARFIYFVIELKVKVNNVPKNILTEALWQNKFLPKHINRLHLLEGKVEAVHEESQAENEDNAEERAALEALQKRVQDIREREEFFKAVKVQPDVQTRGNCYQYLLDMPIYSLTKERYEQLLKEAAEADREYKIMMSKTVETLWLEDLARFELAYDILENQMQSNIINGPITISDVATLKKKYEIDKQYADMQDAGGDSDVEPELIPVKKVVKAKKEVKDTSAAAPKAPRAPRAPKAAKADAQSGDAAAYPYEGGKPTLLRKVSAKRPEIAEKTKIAPPKRANTRRKAVSSESDEEEIELVSDSAYSSTLDYSYDEEYTDEAEAGSSTESDQKDDL